MECRDIFLCKEYVGIYFIERNVDIFLYRKRQGEVEGGREIILVFPHLMVFIVEDSSISPSHESDLK